MGVGSVAGHGTKDGTSATDIDTKEARKIHTSPQQHGGHDGSLYVADGFREEVGDRA